MAFSGTKGYSSYRGRGNKGKIFLAILLLLIIIVSVGFIFVREHMSYDAEGNLHWPWAQEPTVETPPSEIPDGDVTIQEPEPPAVQTAGSGALLASTPLTMEDWTVHRAAHEADSLSAVTAVTLKDSSGKVYFDSSAALSGTVAIADDTAQALAALTVEPSMTAIARIACFHDPKAANSDVEGRGLKNTGGYIFYDGTNSQWLDPGKNAARAYLTELIQEAAELGFDEILLTDVSYPTVGKLDKIAYTYADGSLSEAAGRQANLTAFLKEVRDALPAGVTLSLELEADTILAGENTAAGQALAELAPLVDRIYAITTESDIPALREAVSAASASCLFVPELTTTPPAETDSWLLRLK